MLLARRAMGHRDVRMITEWWQQSQKMTRKILLLLMRRRKEYLLGVAGIYDIQVTMTNTIPNLTKNNINIGSHVQEVVPSLVNL